jgi:hypothetical protein
LAFKKNLKVSSFLISVSVQLKPKYPVWQTGLSGFGHWTYLAFPTGSQ